MIDLTRRSLLAMGAGALALPVLGHAQVPRQASNVLFICVDDLNEWVGCLDTNKATRTPNIDRLAASGTLFRNAYTPVPTCKPARESVLRGLLPMRTGVYTNEDTVPGWLRARTNLPRLFRRAGYRSLGGGKVFHGKFHYAGLNTLGRRSALWQEEYAQDDDWDEFHHFDHECLPDPWPAAGIDRREFDWGEAPPAHATPDERLADWATGILRKPSDKPFFLTVGIYKPHAPWYAPKEFIDLIDDDEIPMPVNPPEAMKRLYPAYDSSRYRDPIEKKGLTKAAIKGYLAATAYADHQIGRIIDALHAGPHAANTHVVLWSDNGHHLGEKRQWGKQTLWEQSTHVPMIIAPVGGAAGQHCDHCVSTVDLMQTVCGLAGITPPGDVDGRDLAPLLAAPDMPWHYPALSIKGPDTVSLRYGPYRYTRYSTGAVELYDHRDDRKEWNNRADNPAYAPVVRQFEGLFPKRFTEPASGPLTTKLRRRLENYTDWINTAVTLPDPCGG
ncbi:sulfatase [Emcibacter sp. SYSU 3D8]|uniref:sulfatase n=1 Tax=Emcibacter sp. SYSU 3D8 TaxID=3133969 RepID=UPI0031FE8F64